MQEKSRITKLLAINEWSKFEVKRAACLPKRLLETVCSFVNTEGGILVLGMEDPDKALGKDRLIGLSENPNNVSDFLKLLRSEFEPPLQHLVATEEEMIINADGGKDKLLVVTISKGDDIHSLKNGDTFTRKGSQNIKIGASEILRLRYEKGSIKFENELSSITSLRELDDTLLQKYKKDTGSEGEDSWQFLKDNGLAKSKSGKMHLTKAGILLFGGNPAVLLGNKCSIKISHYFGTEPTFSGEPNFVRRPLTIEGPLLKQIDETLHYFQTAVKESAPRLEGGTFKPSLLIPEWVFQEAVANAVIHRNYSVQNDVQIRFFDDRIEVESPGTYPAHITSTNIRSERFARNPIIQRVLNRFQNAPNLDIGEGVDRMYALMKQYNLYEPIFFPVKIRPNSVHLILYNLHTIDYWDTVSNFLDRYGRITNKQTREITGIADTLEVSRLLGSWATKGLLEKVGKTKGAYYIKTGQDILSFLLFKESDK